jgi:hypothetical protein
MAFPFRRPRTHGPQELAYLRTTGVTRWEWKLALKLSLALATTHWSTSWCSPMSSFIFSEAVYRSFVSFYCWTRQGQPVSSSDANAPPSFMLSSLSPRTLLQRIVSHSCAHRLAQAYLHLPAWPQTTTPLFKRLGTLRRSLSRGLLTCIIRRGS